MQEQNDFLPENYEVPETGSGYMKLKDGDNVFRVLSSAITGYEYWTAENKPIRSKEAFAETPNVKVGQDGKPQKQKHFWAFVVWNYANEAIEILQITQSSIQGSISNLVKDEDWGNPRAYDIKVNRAGTGIETEYSVNPKPKKELDVEILEAYAKKPINLDALYSGANPFELIESTDF